VEGDGIWRMIWVREGDGLVVGDTLGKGYKFWGRMG